jgi:hypothetical protein
MNQKWSSSLPVGKMLVAEMPSRGNGAASFFSLTASPLRHLATAATKLVFPAVDSSERKKCFLLVSQKRDNSL